MPILNIPSFKSLDTSYLRYGLNHCYINKSKSIKKLIAVELEALTERLDPLVAAEEKENLHEFLRKATNIFSQNIKYSKDNTFLKTKELRDNEDIVLLSGDKDSSVVIMHEVDYKKKVTDMLEEGSKTKNYTSCSDSILKDRFYQNFLLRHFKNHEFHSTIRPTSNQSALFFATAKTHKFISLSDITPSNIIFRPIIDETGTCFYQTDKFLAEYLKPLANNRYTLKNTQLFSGPINKLLPFRNNEEDVSNDMEFFFSNVPIEFTIKYICDQIYLHKKLSPFCNRFTKLLKKVTTENIFSANGVLYKQLDVAMGGPLLVVFSNCFMNSMEEKLVIPSNPTFYIRYVVDIYVRRNNDCTDSFFQALKNYHPNIKLTLELSPSKFPDSNILRLADGTGRFSAVHKSTKLSFHYSFQVRTRYKKCVIKDDLHRSEMTGSCFAEKTNRIVMKYLKAGYLINFIKSQISIFSRPKDDYLIPKNMFDERIHAPAPKLTFENLRNAVVRWKEHEYHQGKSEPTKHLLENSAHYFCW